MAASGSDADMLGCFFSPSAGRCANHGDKMAVDLGRKGKKDPRPLFRNAEGSIGFYRGTLQSLGVRNAEGPAGFYQGIRWVWRAHSCFQMVALPTAVSKIIQHGEPSNFSEMGSKTWNRSTTQSGLRS